MIQRTINSEKDFFLTAIWSDMRYLQEVDWFGVLEEWQQAKAMCRAGIQYKDDERILGDGEWKDLGRIPVK